ncbi:alginate lyase family protein [Dyadobacter sp. CY312]|uniref:alginate lyase family protein n=1 Tax=Dyadobacter sp. CY312 TaxID=2907303 RepID=UPI001F1C89F4|nr:alginate lyase family protein [Dyadobacter sp. CY312]MCE7041756.1 alginate lyase family protein [Dyadobacter sp. CY312]
MLYRLLVLVFLYLPIQVQSQSFVKEIEQTLRSKILDDANWAIKQKPLTVTSESSPRSAGTKHDFYSEGDYWWPDSLNPDGPYVQRDGLTNPDNFVAHRILMIRFSRIVGALASAYKITGDSKYVSKAFEHIDAWFVNPETRMNPSLLYAQAIKGKVTGRGIGIIDTIHLMEVAQAIRIMENHKSVNKTQLALVKNWFDEYITWLTTHSYGKDEMEAKNNHGTCWVMQVASFATLTGNRPVIDFCRERYKSVLLPNQMAADGSFPLELKRTKPYGYSIFNLDAMVMICQILSDKQDDLWLYQTADGKSIRKGIEYLYPFVTDKNKWALKPDVMYWENWPVAQPFLVFGSEKFQNKNWLNTWKGLDHSPKVEEVIRNVPIRNPLIWMK